MYRKDVLKLDENTLFIMKKNEEKRNKIMLALLNKEIKNRKQLVNYYFLNFVDIDKIDKTILRNFLTYFYDEKDVECDVKDLFFLKKYLKDETSNFIKKSSYLEIIDELIDKLSIYDKSPDFEIMDLFKGNY